MRENRTISLRKMALETGVREYAIYGFANNTLRDSRRRATLLTHGDCVARDAENYD